ncbi:UNVERIFIED_CONTAM: Deoxyhypusine hydroxylase-B [Sesamum latifolium]|uniref:Deoxyhypusine hydroxylase n=1 Tax=Sesamum latifolium TaxID=2727402 RepID=A0AAW2WRY1_9LAMI
MKSFDGDCSFQVSSETERFLCERLLDHKQPISERFRALFSLRNLHGALPRNALIQATRDSSNLLAHEAAFALGQMQDAEAIPALEAVLNDLSLHPIVRHEAAEALGAIGLEHNVSLLKNSLVSDPAQEVRETCELALSRIEELMSTSISVSESSRFLSVDPAAPAACSSEVLLNEDKSMYERYAALFVLRNLGEEEAISAIVESLGANSALLRREVAYVLGQLQNKKASLALFQVLRDVNEHPMVRHEAAEALGSIADNQCIALLEEFAKDPEPIVSQSCEVALSMLEFERSGKSFEVTENKKDSVPFHAGTSSAAGVLLSWISVYEQLCLCYFLKNVQICRPNSVCLIESNESDPMIL